MSMYLSDMPINNAELIRDGQFDILGLSNTECNGKKILSFIEDKKYLEEALNNRDITCFITTKELCDLIREQGYGVLCAENPRYVFFELHNTLSENPTYRRAAFKTTIGENCKISPLAYIEPDNVQIGNNVVIEEFVSIRGNCVIGDNCVIHSGAQIGGSGYEFKKKEDGILDVEHCGGVIIGENTIVWSGSSIHKAVYPWDNTVIGDFARINSNSHIDHGAKLGNRVKICAGCIVSGRCSIGEDAVIGPGAVISNRIRVGRNATVSLGAVVTKDVEDEVRVTGNFAIAHEEFINRLKQL